MSAKEIMIECMCLDAYDEYGMLLSKEIDPVRNAEKRIDMFDPEVEGKRKGSYPLLDYEKYLETLHPWVTE